jgi:hypothetical protein
MRQRARARESFHPLTKGKVMNPPVDVYEEIARLNRKGLDEAIASLNFDRMHRCFNRMVNALEEVEQYRMEEARKELRYKREIEGE